jgi:hypothetical protein
MHEKEKVGTTDGDTPRLASRAPCDDGVAMGPVDEMGALRRAAYRLAFVLGPLAYPLWRFVVHPLLHWFGINHVEVP